MRYPKLKSEFMRNVFTLAMGTVIAQAIPILISPVLTRIYSPENFGVFALYMSLVLTASTIATGSYEHSVTLPRKDETARYLVALSLAITAGYGLVLFAVAAAFRARLTEALGNPEIGPWLLLVPLGVFLTGAFQSFNYWLNRRKEFKRLAFARVTQTGSAALAQIAIGLGAPGPAGLILGSVTGQALSLASFAAVKERFLPPLDGDFLRNVKTQARRYRNFPTLQAPSTLIEASSSQLPVFLLGILYNPTVVGLFALSQRVVRLPMAVVGGAIGDVFRQRASKDYAELGDSSRIFAATLKKLVLISTPCFLFFLAAAPTLFAFVFGEDWRVAGEYARLMTPLFWLSFIVSPLSVMFIIAEKQRFDLVIQVLLIAFSAAGIVSGHHFFADPKYSIGAFSFVYSIKYLVELYFAHKFCKTDAACSQFKEIHG